MSKTSQRTQAVEFLKKYVIGRCLITHPIETHIEHDLIVSAYEEDVIFSNLNETAQGFSFDMTTLARGTRYLNRDHLLAEGTLNAVRVIRYEITERLSSGDLIGHSHFISSTNSHPDPFTGTIFFVRMILNGNVLNVEEGHVGYADVPTADGKFRPVATEGHYTYSIEKGGLAIKYEQKTFNVNPKTLQRTPTGEKYPVQVSHEIAFPAPLPVEEN